jgi:FAD:protein FMN transferase
MRFLPFPNLQSNIRNDLLQSSLGLFLLFSLLIFPSQVRSEQVFRQSRMIMGTSVEITVSQVNSDVAGQAIDAAFGAIERVDILMSNYRQDSEVRRIVQNAGKEETIVSPETFEVIERAIYFGDLSEGALDVTIAPVFRLWNFRDGKMPEGKTLRENLKKVDYRRIAIDRSKSSVYLPEAGMDLDLGAIAKGYAADCAGRVMRKIGVRDFIINPGGDLLVSGAKAHGVPWSIGIQHPRLPSEFVAVLKPDQGAVVTSGDYKKYFIRDGKRYHHIINPATGYPAEEAQSVTIMAPSAMDADALATAVFVLGPKKGFTLLESLPDVHAIIIDKRGSVLLSKKWPKGVVNSP